MLQRFRKGAQDKRRARRVVRGVAKTSSMAMVNPSILVSDDDMLEIL